MADKVTFTPNAAAKLVEAAKLVLGAPTDQTGERVKTLGYSPAVRWAKIKTLGDCTDPIVSRPTDPAGNYLSTNTAHVATLAAATPSGAEPYGVPVGLSLSVGQLVAYIPTGNGTGIIISPYKSHAIRDSHDVGPPVVLDATEIGIDTDDLTLSAYSFAPCDHNIGATVGWRGLDVQANIYGASPSAEQCCSDVKIVRFDTDYTGSVGDVVECKVVWTALACDTAARCGRANTAGRAAIKASVFVPQCTAEITYATGEYEDDDDGPLVRDVTCEDGVLTIHKCRPVTATKTVLIPCA